KELKFAQKIEDYSFAGNGIPGPGRYVAQFISIGDRGDSILSEFEFEVIGNTPGKYLSEKELFLMYKDGNSFQPGDTAELLIGSCLQGATVYLEYINLKGIEERVKVFLSREQKILRIPIHFSDYGGIKIVAITTYHYREFSV